MLSSLLISGGIFQNIPKCPGKWERVLIYCRKITQTMQNFELCCNSKFTFSPLY